MSFRTEKDFIGQVKIPVDALYGIHSLRAVQNFQNTSPFPKAWYKALGTVKKACYLTAADFFEKTKVKYPNKSFNFRILDKAILANMIESTTEIEDGMYAEHFIVPAISGGAGTSFNMNINEIIANCTLMKLGKNAGDYALVDPIEHANIFQSTNDVVPTSLHVAAIKLLNQLEERINKLREAMETLEKHNRESLRIGFTQMQQAVPTSFGRLFSTYNDALSRDWWRVSKCFERIKVVNLGGSAIGTGITVPRYFIMEVIRTLQRITSLPLTRGENLSDATNNQDALVEVHGILKAHAVNLEKMVNDLRLLSSDLLGDKSIFIPEKQAGSSIMPGKVNPVIPEYVISVAHKVYANDQLITHLCAQGCLELNAYIPIIGSNLIESLELLISANTTICDNLIDGLKVNTKTANDQLRNSPSITTALVPYIGYNNCTLLAQYMKDNSCSVIQANRTLKLIDDNKLMEILRPENILQEGFTLNDIVENEERKR
ncbi:MAG: hypothetical protein MI922_14385 [Bacteroidales bacterium]|nr:hypothetical protein [Bacteroidales bacterium]